MAEKQITKQSIGRPTKLTEALHTQFVLHVRAGATPERVAAALGIHARTYYVWMEKGRMGDETYEQFQQDVTRAMHETVMNAEILVRRGDPRAFLRMSPLARGNSDMPGWGSNNAEQEEQPAEFTASEDELFEQLMERLDRMAEREAIGSPTDPQ
tara:strand:- start:305 stop:769 length:465 start_codon:yes stop_codon:yes gene_type:complete